MKNHFGFTLAEVLITLGIIGVVAAMTMPTLMNSTQGAQYKAAYKKALSALSQAVTLNVALDDTSFAEAVAGPAGKTDKPETGESVAHILHQRMNIVKVSGKPTSEEYSPITTSDADFTTTDVTGADTYLYFNDGMMFAFKAADVTSCTLDSTITGNKKCVGFIDVNGHKGPNKVVKCDTGKFTAGQAASAAVGKEGEEGYKPAVDAKEASCTAVTNPTDIYPVVFYDQSVLPSTAAAKAVLYGK